MKLALGHRQSRTRDWKVHRGDQPDPRAAADARSYPDAATVQPIRPLPQRAAIPAPAGTGFGLAEDMRFKLVRPCSHPAFQLGGPMDQPSPELRPCQIAAIGIAQSRSPSG